MEYEAFLFTRNQRRDFTAFVRPAALTNREISTLAAALNAVHDISALGRAWPALYCFPLGEYVLLLRHYDSGRTHAGRAIGALEGIAVRRIFARRFALALPHFLAHQDELLAISQHAGDIDLLEPTESPLYPWPDVRAVDAPDGPAQNLIDDFASRLTGDRLFLPFNDDGRALLLAALSDPRMPTLYFAFGTNADVLNRLGDVQIDIISYFNTTTPALRDRQTNEITAALSDYVYRPRARPAPALADQHTPPADPLPTPRQMRAGLSGDDPPSQPGALADYRADDAMLTPREMARRARTAEEAQEQKAPETPLGWLAHLLARLLGRG